MAEEAEADDVDVDEDMMKAEKKECYPDELVRIDLHLRRDQILFHLLGAAIGIGHPGLSANETETAIANGEEGGKLDSLMSMWMSSAD